MAGYISILYSTKMVNLLVICSAHLSLLLNMRILSASLLTPSPRPFPESEFGGLRRRSGVRQSGVGQAVQKDGSAYYLAGLPNSHSPIPTPRRADWASFAAAFDRQPTTASVSAILCGRIDCRFPPRAG